MKEHPQFKLLERASLKRALQVGERIAPDEQVDADRRPVLEKRDEVLRRRRLLIAAGRVAEVAFVASELTESG